MLHLYNFSLFSKDFLIYIKKVSQNRVKTVKLRKQDSYQNDFNYLVTLKILVLKS